TGTLLTETMLVGAVNDDQAHLAATARFIAALKPKKAYILVPTRPPARLDIVLPTPDALAAAWQIFNAALPPDTAEMLTGHEGNAFSSTGDARADILAITAVHPLRTANIESILAAAGASWDIVESLKNEGLVSEVTFGADRFIVRTLHTFTKG
ncbi:MAG TPA: radical SAM protein, partial [bacterium]|nr:radical SAM protein [bacterium]